MKFAKTAALLLGLTFLAASSASAQTLTTAEQARIASANQPKYAFSDTQALAAGVVILGAAGGIGMIAKGAVESMARQPEVAGQINLSMIIAAAFIEGVAFFALIVVILKSPY